MSRVATSLYRRITSGTLVTGTGVLHGFAFYPGTGNGLAQCTVTIDSGTTTNAFSLSGLGDSTTAGGTGSVVVMFPSGVVFSATLGVSTLSGTVSTCHLLLSDVTGTINAS